MEPTAERANCQGCGGEFPVAEMFGLAGDHRCPDCAQSLRQRHNPAVVRRMASSQLRISGHEPRVTIGLIATFGVLWIAWQIPALKELLVRGFYMPRMELRPEEMRWAVFPLPWQVGAWPFLHQEIWHVALNGWWYFQMGRYLEWGWGGSTVLAITVGAGIAGAGAGWLINGAFTIGASGGAFGMIGWFVAQRRHHVFAQAMVNRVFLNSILASVVLMVVISEFGGIPISHVGHAAGFLWGLAAGRAAASRLPALGWGVLGAATIALLVLPSYVEPLGWNLTLFRRGA